MQRKFEKTLKKFRKIHLQPKTKEAIHGRLLVFLEENPLQKTVNLKTENQRWYSGMFFPAFQRLSIPLFVAFLVFVVAGGGTVLAAEGAIPGDVLYPVKIHINEAARAAFVFDEKSSANLDIQQTQRRMNEAEKLETKGQLNPQVQKKISREVENHVKRVDAAVIKLEAKGNTRAAAEVRLELREYLEKTSEKFSALGIQIKEEKEEREERVDEKKSDREKEKEVKKEENKKRSDNNEEDEEKKQEEQRINIETDIEVNLKTPFLNTRD
ncbi:MAG: hypothetical protein AAB431_00625 [Patescibacteria group bacterium]